MVTQPQFVSTRNACKLCKPLGASLVFKGIERTVPFLHGSQGCATYIRRYVISHYKEPIDIASSSFVESDTIFGGKKNFTLGLENVIRQYNPKCIGIATTCLSETIGDDVSMFIHEFKKEHAGSDLPQLIHVSTPSYCGTHAEGFHATVRATVQQLAKKNEEGAHINIFSGIVSPADIRYLKRVMNDFHLPYILFPDYSDTLDGPAWSEYHPIPEGGTKLADLQRLGDAVASIEFGTTLQGDKTAGSWLQENHEVPNYLMTLPIGVRNSDRFFRTLENISNRETPKEYTAARGRLVDSYVDAHKYIFGKRAMLYGEEDLVIAMASFLSEIGIVPAFCASGGKSGRMRETLREMIPEHFDDITVMDGADFVEIEEEAKAHKPDLIIGNSKGYKIADSFGVPIVRIGFPVHDRIGGARLHHLGYYGTQQLFDRIANAIIETKQQTLPPGYFYM